LRHGRARVRRGADIVDASIDLLLAIHFGAWRVRTAVRVETREERVDGLLSDGATFRITIVRARIVCALPDTREDHIARIPRRVAHRTIAAARGVAARARSAATHARSAPTGVRRAATRARSAPASAGRVRRTGLRRVTARVGRATTDNKDE